MTALFNVIGAFLLVIVVVQLVWLACILGIALWNEVQQKNWVFVITAPVVVSAAIVVGLMVAESW